MQIDLVLRDKKLTFADGSPTEFVVSHNADYVLHIDIEESDRRTAMFAAFVRNGESVLCKIDEQGYVLNDDDERNVPMWALDAPYLHVGVVSSGYSSLPLTITVKGSIKAMYEQEIVSPDDPLVEQLIELVNNLAIGGLSFTTDETLTLTQNGVLKVNTVNDAEHDNTLPITSAGVYTQIGNINALLETI